MSITIDTSHINADGSCAQKAQVDVSYLEAALDKPALIVLKNQYDGDESAGYVQFPPDIACEVVRAISNSIPPTLHGGHFQASILFTHGKIHVEGVRDFVLTQISLLEKAEGYLSVELGEPLKHSLENEISSCNPKADSDIMVLRRDHGCIEYNNGWTIKREYGVLPENRVADGHWVLRDDQRRFMDVDKYLSDMLDRHGIASEI